MAYKDKLVDYVSIENDCLKLEDYSIINGEWYLKGRIKKWREKEVLRFFL